MKPKTIAILVVIGLFIIILFQNSDATSLEMFFWDIRMPLFVLIVSTVFIGWIIGWFTHLAYRKGKQKGGAPKATSGVEQLKAAKSEVKEEAQEKDSPSKAQTKS